MLFRMSLVQRSAKMFSLYNTQHFNFQGEKHVHILTWLISTSWSIKRSYGACVQTLTGRGTQEIANLQQSFLRNQCYCDLFAEI